jgi:glycosyltransferase involved in cell wall biosynthesis
MKLSIVTAVLNDRANIEYCIESVLGQVCRDVEHIIIDGGSTDGTTAIIQKHASRVAKWISEPDGGIYDAMNKGIALSTGDVVGILNADDAYDNSNVLERVAEVMADRSVDACYGDLVYVAKNDSNRIVRCWRSKTFADGLFEKGWAPAHPTFFVRKSAYERCGLFDLRYKLAADFDLMARLLHGFRVKSVYVPEVFVKMRLGGVTNRSILNIMRQNIEIYQACRRNGIAISPTSFAVSKACARLTQYVAGLKAKG